MPSPIGQSSAPLLPLALVADGVSGLNLQASNQLLDPTWATVANNLVLSVSGNLSSRLGWQSLTTNPVNVTNSSYCRSMFEFLPITGAPVVISTLNNKIYSGVASFVDVSPPGVTITANNWKFVNFNGYCYGLQTGHPLIQYTGTGTFTVVTAATGTTPNGNELLSAFGRLWATDSTGQLLIYSQLLDATNWTVTGAGNFNLTSVWANGDDRIVALASYNNLLIVFGTKNVIVWSDQSGSDLGMDPNNMSVYDIVPGIGTVARDSIQNCNGDDLAFLAPSGVQSLKRVIIERSNAIKNLSLNVRDALNAQVKADDPDNIKSTYNAFYGLYLLLIPGSSVIYAFDTKLTLQDGSWRVTTWDGFIPTALLTLHDNQTTYCTNDPLADVVDPGLEGSGIFQYGGSADNAQYQDGSGSYQCTYESPWLVMDPSVQTRIKILKKISSIVNYFGSGTLTVRWAFDFQQSWNSYQVPLTGSSSLSQWGISQFGIDSFGSGTSAQTVPVPASGAGQYIKIGLDFTINNSNISFLQTQMYSKVGRVI